MQKHYTHLFFDLDGTLVNSGEGITRCAQHALRHFGIDVPDLSSLRPFVGPPLEDSFKDFYGLSEAEAHDAVEVYRQRYFSKGVYEQSPYPGVFDFLAEVKRRGYVIAIATSKIERMATFVVNTLFPEFSKYIDHVFARDDDGVRHTKADVIRHGLATLGTTDTSRVLMIGDRKFDVAGAKSCGIDSIGLLLGFGDEEELRTAGADYVCKDYEDILNILNGEDGKVDGKMDGKVDGSVMKSDGFDYRKHSPAIGTTIEWHGCTLTWTEEGWRAEVKHRMNRRCNGWDYCRPWVYMITIKTQRHTQPPRLKSTAGGRQTEINQDGERGDERRDDMYPEVIPQETTPSHATPAASSRPRLLTASSSPRLLTATDPLSPQWLSSVISRKGNPHLFGELNAIDGKPYIALNAFGTAVQSCICSIPAHYPQCRILRLIVMPNHVHFVIHVKERLPEKKPLGYIVHKFKVAVNQAFKEIVLGGDKTMPVEVDGAGTDPKHPKVGLVFEEGFHDRILFRSNQLDHMCKYILDNPRRLWELAHNRQYFEKILHYRITMPLLPGSGTNGTGRWWDYYPGGRQKLETDGGASGLLSPIETTKDTMTVTFNAIGNRELLQVPERMQIQCSRKMTEQDIDTLITEAVEACKHGVIIVSPCISKGEQRVARAVMDAGYPLIVLFPNGIPPKEDIYKPYGQYFDACSRGKLLILSPWDFTPTQRAIARWQCLMLNDMAAQISVGL
ncbi:MAG: HAD hydrolase-like protein [Bacteroidaceae bacterium]|nr:HAD hydrolase-like protein [Bacteroidaceae bacterium]